MDNSYACTLCGKSKVKLWRPYSDTAPLICAECAEKRQSELECDEFIWLKDSCGRLVRGRSTGKRIPRPKWKVNDKGMVPHPESILVPDEAGIRVEETDQLIVDLSNETLKVTLIPAIKDEHGNFFTYSKIPIAEFCDWEKLPTR